MKAGLVKRYLKILASYYLGYPVYQPDSVSLSITDRCNLKCRMCEYWKVKKEETGCLSLKECEDLFLDMARHGIKRVQITGGEPLIRPDILNIFCSAKAAGLSIDFVTNGTLIDKNNAGSILDSVDSVYVSLDSPESAAHDDIRGVAGAFEMTIKGIKTLSNSRNNKGNKPVITVCCVIGMRGLHDPEAMWRLVKRLGADRLIYNPASTVSYGNVSLRNDFIPGDDGMKRYDRMIDKIIALTYRKDVSIKSNPFYMESSKRFLRGDRRYHRFSCYSGGYNGSFVNFNGDVFPCCAWNFSLGNIKTRPFSEIWKSQKAALARKQIRNKKCPMCNHHTRIFDYTIQSPRLIKNPVKLWKGFHGL